MVCAEVVSICSCYFLGGCSKSNFGRGHNNGKKRMSRGVVSYRRCGRHFSFILLLVVWGFVLEYWPILTFEHFLHTYNDLLAFPCLIYVRKVSFVDLLLYYICCKSVSNLKCMYKKEISEKLCVAGCCA